MGNTAWKQAERAAADLIGGRRYPANMGGAVDCESSWCVAQVKLVQRLSLPALEALALEAERQGMQRTKLGVVVVKRSRARGPRLVVMTEAMFRAYAGALPTRSGEA